MKDSSKLDGDVARADNDSALGKLLEVEEAVRVEAEVVAGDVLGKGRSATDGDDEAVGGVLTLNVGTAVSLRLGVGGDDGDGVLVEELGVTGDVVDAVLLDVCRWEKSRVSQTGKERNREKSTYSSRRYR